MLKKMIGIAALAVVLAACDSGEPQQQAKVAAKSGGEDKPAIPASVKATALLFQEQEKGVEPYSLRMLITPKFLRMDDGPDATSFLLYDRKKKTIFNVNDDDKTVLVIQRRSLGMPESERPELTIADNDTTGMPSLNTLRPVHKTLKAGKNTCYDVVAVPELMPDAVAAMREYLVTLSSQQIENLDKTPVEMRNPCMMANLIYYPDKHLTYGFPLREWDYRGFVRELLDFGQETVNGDLFSVGDGYQKITLGRSGMKRE